MSDFLQVGSPAPIFSVQDQLGREVTLKDFAGKKVVLYFYPKDHTPGCTQESCDFRDHHSQFLKAGAVVFGVSRDSVRSHQSFIEKHSLPFSLLSDETGKMCEAYGVWKEKSMYGKKYMGIERTTVIIGKTGLIEGYFPKVSVKGHVGAVLELTSKGSKS